MNPARISVRTVVPRSLRPKYLSSILGPPACPSAPSVPPAPESDQEPCYAGEMIRFPALCGAALLWGTAALAASPPAPPPGGVSVSADGQVVVSSKACAEVVAHVPDAGVAYTPGVDVNGNPVAPADLPDSASPIAADNFPIFLTLELRRKFRVPDRARLFKLEAVVGLIAVQGNQVFFNGQPIAPGEADLLAAACRAHGF